MLVSLPSALHNLLEVYRRYSSASQRKSESSRLKTKPHGFLYFLQISKQSVTLTGVLAGPC